MSSSLTQAPAPRNLSRAGLALGMKPRCLASRMTGEALATQRSATPEIFLQILHAHLHRGNAMLVEQVEKRFLVQA